MLGTIRICRNIWQVNFSFQYRAQLNLGFFGSFAQTLERLAILAQVDALIALKFVGCPVDDDFIPVVTAQMRVAIGGFNYRAAAYFKQ